MNYKFNLSDIHVSAPEAMVDVKIGNIAVEVTDLSLMESLKVAKELPGIILELRHAIELPLTPPPHVCGMGNMPPFLAHIMEDIMRKASQPTQDTDRDDEISEEDEVESVTDADASMEQLMFEALTEVTGIHAGEFIGGIDTDKQRGTWDTKAYTFCVATRDDSAMHNRKRWFFIGGKGYFDVYIKAEDKDAREFGERLKEKYAVNA